LDGKPAYFHNLEAPSTHHQTQSKAMTEDATTLSDDLALRIGLAARALPDTDPARLIRVLADAVGLPPTIAKLDGLLAEFWITPHTKQVTNLRSAEIGQKVTLEVDMLAKHVEKLLEGRATGQR
jgi:hypothetical protein